MGVLSSNSGSVGLVRLQGKFHNIIIIDNIIDNTIIIYMLGNRGVDDRQEEMNNQEKAFLFMSPELQANGDPDGAIQMFLKYSPDSLTRLFDRCIIKPCQAQVIPF